MKKGVRAGRPETAPEAGSKAILYMPGGTGFKRTGMAKDHISICVCSFKRPHLLQNTLENLRNLKTDSQFTYSVVVADNDRAESAKATVEGFARTAGFEVVY